MWIFKPSTPNYRGDANAGQPATSGFILWQWLESLFGIRAPNYRTSRRQPKELDRS